MTQVLPEAVKKSRSGSTPPSGISEQPAAAAIPPHPDRFRNSLRFMGTMKTLDRQGRIVEPAPRPGRLAECFQSLVLDQPLADE